MAIVVVEAGDHRPAGIGGGVVEVQVAVVAGVERKPQQSFLGAATADLIAQVDKFGGEDALVGQLLLPEVPDSSSLLGNEDFIAHAKEHVGGCLSIVGGKDPL